MKKKTLLLTTLAGTMLVAGMTATGVKAAVGENAKAIVREEANGTGTAYVELVNSKYVLNKADITELINKKYVDAGIAGTKVADVKVGETAVEEGGAVGTGATVELNNNRKLTVVVYGDVTGEGEVTTVDAKRTLEGGLESPYSEAADVANGGTKTVDAKRILEYSTQGTKFEDNFVDSENEKTDNILGNVKTVKFHNTKTKEVTEGKTDANGKLTKLPDDLTADGAIFYGWTKDSKTHELVDANTVIEEDGTVLYSVWVKDVAATVKIHNGSDEPAELTGYKAGMEIDLTSEEFAKNATLDFGEKPGVTCTHTGWFVKEDATRTAYGTDSTNRKYVIPPIYDEDEAAVPENVEVNFYPSWDVKVDSTAKVEDLEKILEVLENDAEQSCGNVVINAEVQLSQPINIPEGVNVTFKKPAKLNGVTVPANGTLTFDDEVTFNGELKLDDNYYKENTEVPTAITFNDDVVVGDSAYLPTKGIEKADGITVTKQVSNSKVDSENVGLSDSLNNEEYNIVQLKDSVIEEQELVIEEDTKTTLDLNGKQLYINSYRKMKNNGDLTIIDATKANAHLIATGEIVNSGNLVIGEINTEGEEVTGVKGVTIDNRYASDGLAVITNTGSLIINDGEIKDVVTTKASRATIENGAEGTLEINGGIVNSETTQKSPAILNEGEAIITGGTIERTNNNDTHPNGYYAVVNHGKMTIKDGTFKMSKNNIANATSALIENGYSKGNEALDENENPVAISDLTIEDGTFEGGRYLIASDYNAKTTVKGGHYKAVKATDDPLENGNMSKDATRSIFKVVGEMILDFDKESTIDLGTSSKTKVALIGDQYLKADLSETNKVLKDYLEVHQLDLDKVKITEGESEVTVDNLSDLFKIEKESNGTGTKLEKSKIVIHIGGEEIDPVDAGKHLLSIMKNFVATNSITGVDNEKNVVEIILDGDVEIEKQTAPAVPGYKLTKQNTTLKMNGHNLTIHSLYTFSNNITVEGNGKITLINPELETYTLDIYTDGDMMTDDELAAVAEEEEWIEVNKATN